MPLNAYEGEGHGDHELPDGDVGQDVVDQIRRTRAHTSAQADWAHGSGLAAYGLLVGEPATSQSPFRQDQLGLLRQS